MHHSAIMGEGFKSLAEDQEEEFEVTQGQKGLQAQNVVKLKVTGINRQTPAV